MAWIYFLLCVIQPIFLPIPEMVTVLWGSVEIGPIKSFVLGVIGAIIGISIMYWVTKKGSHWMIARFKGEEKIEIFQNYVRKYQIYIVGILFIVPILPDEIICLGAPFVGIPFPTFIVIAILSKIVSVGMIAFSEEIAAAFSISRIELIMIELVILFVVARIYTGREKKEEKDVIMSN